MSTKTENLSEKRGHLRRDAILIGVFVSLIVVLLWSWSAFSIQGCFGPCGSLPVLTSSSCIVDTRTCAVVVVAGTMKIGAVNCTLGVGGRGVGILSNRVGGPATPVDIPAGSSVTVYCLQYQQNPTLGAQAVGYVQFSNGLELAFSSIWA
ncbi:MAG TPA: hypothetical protein VGR53_03380 [Nitrososphaerales archaeon]|nr:hypothetical protein [Nitrososphaerales archaeon]